MAIFIVVAMFAFGEIFNPLPGSCADYSGPASLAPANPAKRVSAKQDGGRRASCFAIDSETIPQSAS